MSNVPPTHGDPEKFCGHPCARLRAGVNTACQQFALSPNLPFVVVVFFFNLMISCLSFRSAKNFIGKLAMFKLHLAVESHLEASPAPGLGRSPPPAAVPQHRERGASSLGPADPSEVRCRARCGFKFERFLSPKRPVVPEPFTCSRNSQGPAALTKGCSGPRSICRLCAVRKVFGTQFVSAYTHRAPVGTLPASLRSNHAKPPAYKDS